MPLERLQSSSNAFAAYQRTREQYFSNAQETIGKGELRKASELLWGTITQATKSLASLTNVQLRGHAHIRDFVREVARVQHNEDLFDLFLSLEQLHRNFYDEQIAKEDFPSYQKKVITFLSLIDTLIANQVGSGGG